MQKSIFYLNHFEGRHGLNSKFSPNNAIYNICIADNPAPSTGNQNHNPSGERGISIKRLRNTGTLSDKIKLQRALLLQHCIKQGESKLWAELYDILISAEIPENERKFKTSREQNYMTMGHLSSPALLNYLKSQIQ